MRAIYDDMFLGNEETLQLAKRRPSLVPLAVINPLHFDSTSTYAVQAKRAGFKGFLFASPLQYWTHAQFNFSASLRALAKVQLPIQIIVGSATELGSLAPSFEELKVPILIRQLKGNGYTFLTDTIALAKKYRNLYFDVGNLVSNGAIAYLAKSIGVQRLYFASNAPLNISDCAHGIIEAVPDLTEAERLQILFGTLGKIFKVSRPQQKFHLSSRWTDEIRAPKIDTHWHSDGWDILEPAKGLEKAIPYLNAFGYRAVCVSSIRALNYDLQAGNETTFEALKVDPRFYAYVVVDPLQEDLSLRLLEKFKNHERMVGIKTIQDYYDLTLHHSRYDRIFDWAEKNDYPVMAHLPGLKEAALKFPKVKFIAAHVTWDRLPKLLDSSGKLPSNIWCDIATSHSSQAATNLPELIRHVGIGRILFSVDGPLMSPAWTIGKILAADLSSGERQSLYLQNAQKLLRKIII